MAFYYKNYDSDDSDDEEIINPLDPIDLFGAPAVTAATTPATTSTLPLASKSPAGYAAESRKQTEEDESGDEEFSEDEEYDTASEDEESPDGGRPQRKIKHRYGSLSEVAHGVAKLTTGGSSKKDISKVKMSNGSIRYKFKWKRMLGILNHRRLTTVFKTLNQVKAEHKKVESSLMEKWKSLLNTNDTKKILSKVKQSKVWQHYDHILKGKIALSSHNKAAAEFGLMWKQNKHKNFTKSKRPNNKKKIGKGKGFTSRSGEKLRECKKSGMSMTSCAKQCKKLSVRKRCKSKPRMSKVVNCVFRKQKDLRKEGKGRRCKTKSKSKKVGSKRK